MEEKKSTLLFIPDISGFSNFVNSTEISHSQHIISELLEIIISCDQLGMQVSEIEGDAVLCYMDFIPSTNLLIQQCEKTFKSFHSHLKRYDTERICRCGACESATNLSLKFFIHAGEVEKIKVRDHKKLHGSDVILVHRLMKNSIESSEYILFSENINLQDVDVKKFDWFLPEKGTDKYEILGKVNYQYSKLSSLHENIPESKSISFPQLSSETISFSEVINAPIDIVYENYTNLEKRVQWNEEIKDIILKDGNYNQAGSIHTCIVGDNQLNFETLGRLEDNEKIIYGERLNKLSVIRDLINIFTFEKKGESTIITTDIDFKIKSVFGKILKKPIKKKLQKQSLLTLKKLKGICEGETEKQS